MTDTVDLDRGDAYGAAFAEVYDQWYDQVTDAEATARFVAARLGSGPVLELGVGTGRLAQPLTDAGVDVVGLDASALMLDRCPAGAVSHRVLGDMRDLPFGPDRFGVVLVAFNTLFNVATVEGQRRVLAEAARVVAGDGVVIVEALDGSLLGDAPATSVGVSRRWSDGLVVSSVIVDAEAQVLGGRHLEIDDQGVVVRPWRLRWLTTAQLDDLAAQVGLALTEHHPDWDEPEGSLRGRPAGPNRIAVYRQEAQ